MNREAKIIIVIGVVIILAGLGLAKFSSKNTFTPPADPGKLVREDSHMTGKVGAKVTLVEFGDYQCPFCSQFDPTVEKLVSDFGSNPDFNFVFRNFPLPQHQYAKIAAEAAEAAGAQGKFFDMEHKIYANQNTWVASSNPLDIFVQYATDLGLDANKFKSEVQSNAYNNRIQTDLTDADALGVNSTPTLYLNGEKTNSADYATLKSQIEDALKK